MDPKVVRGLMVLVGLEAVNLLQRKNEAYGNSALDPVRVFSRVGVHEQIRVRLDDKLSRLMRGFDAGEDVMFDMLGYLLLYRVALVYERLNTAGQDKDALIEAIAGLPSLGDNLDLTIATGGRDALMRQLERLGTAQLTTQKAALTPLPSDVMEDVMQHLQSVAPDFLAGAESFDMQVALLTEHLRHLHSVQRSQAEALRGLEEENARLRQQVAELQRQDTANFVERMRGKNIL